MELVELIKEILPSVLSIIACIVAFVKGKGGAKLTAEEIEEKAEAKKQKIITKLNKKNKITPVENSSETNTKNNVVMLESLPVEKMNSTFIDNGTINKEINANEISNT